MPVLRIAFVVSLYFPFGGMQRSLMRMARECVERGHQVDIYTGAWQAELPSNIQVVTLDTRAASNHRSNQILAEKAHAAINRQHYHVVVGFTKIPGLDVYYAADPCYAAKAESERGWLYKLTPRYRALRQQELAVFNPAADTEILLIAHQEKAKFMRHYGTQAQRFHCLPPGINRQRLQAQAQPGQRQAIRAELGIGEQEIMVLSVGSRFHTKGVDRSIEALAALPPALHKRTRLVHVGEGDEKPYRRQASRLRIADQVLFTGVREDVAAFYNAADLLIHAPRTENTGTILIEAMLFGLPVLTTEVCGFAFHVRDAEAGVVCGVPFQQQELNETLASMLSRLDQVQWQKNGPRYCEHTDIEGLIQRAADIIIQRGRKAQQ